MNFILFRFSNTGLHDTVVISVHNLGAIQILRDILRGSTLCREYLFEAMSLRLLEESF
jgi:hypothetical protein